MKPGRLTGKSCAGTPNTTRPPSCHLGTERPELADTLGQADALSSLAIAVHDDVEPTAPAVDAHGSEIEMGENCGRSVRRENFCWEAR